MNRFQTTKKVAILGIIANILLLAAKLLIGFISRSQAMIADGFNSAGDVFASVMTFTGNKIASQPEDLNHPYGHGKAEYIFSMIISFSLLGVAYRIFHSSLDSIMNHEKFIFSWWLVGVGIATIVIKFFLFLYTKKLGKKEHNLLIMANAEDHRNDVFVTSSTLLGIGLSNLGIYWFDGAVGIGISLWIAYTGIRIFLSSYSVLMDTNINEVLKDELEKIINSIKGIDHIDSIAAKPTGFQYILIVKISVPGSMTVRESHIIAAQVKEKLKAHNQVGDVVVHINPA